MPSKPLDNYVLVERERIIKSKRNLLCESNIIWFFLLEIYSTICNGFYWQLAVEYESNAMIVKVDTDDEYEFARDMQVIYIWHGHWLNRIQ